MRGRPRPSRLLRRGRNGRTAARARRTRRCPRDLPAAVSTRIRLGKRWNPARPRARGCCLGELLRHRLREADLGGLHRVVGHTAAAFAPVNRGDHDDDAAAPRPHRGHDETRRSNGWRQRLVERFLPVGVGRLEQSGSARQPDVVDENVHPAERRHRLIDDGLDAVPG